MLQTRPLLCVDREHACTSQRTSKAWQHSTPQSPAHSQHPLQTILGTCDGLRATHNIALCMHERIRNDNMYLSMTDAAPIVNRSFTPPVIMEAAIGDFNPAAANTWGCIHQQHILLVMLVH